MGIEKDKLKPRLTWIESEQRWRKMYRGHRLSFSGAGGKDASYWTALREFKRRKIEIDNEGFRQPVYPRDRGKTCEFSIDGKNWVAMQLDGPQIIGSDWFMARGAFPLARIKKDA